MIPILKFEQKLLISSFLERNYRGFGGVWSCEICVTVHPYVTFLHRTVAKVRRSW